MDGADSIPMVKSFRIFGLMILLVGGRATLGDTVWISNGTATMAFEQIKVVRVDQETIVFRTTASEATWPISKVARLAIDDEKLLTAAERARSDGQWDVATDSYARTLSSTDKPWLKDWAALRLLECGEHSGRFDMAVTAYVALAMRWPGYALGHKPKLPAAGSTFLDMGASEIQSALGSAKTDEQQQALLWLLLDIYRAKNDTGKSAEVARKISSLKVASTPAAGGGDAGALLADLKLNSAKLAVEQGNFSKAIAEVESAKASFSDSNHQAEALFCIARARQGMAEQAKTGESYKDAALAYLRVVAHFREVASTPHVAESMVAAGSIMERLNDRAAALRLYQEVVSRYNNAPAAVAAAQQGIARLNARGK